MDGSIDSTKEGISVYRSAFERWWPAVAVASVGLGAGLRLLPDSLFGGSVAFITFYPVVAMAALLAGARAGLLATALSAVVADLAFHEPRWAFNLEELSDWIAVFLFLGMGVLISLVAGKLREAQRRVREGLERDRLVKIQREGEARLAQVANIVPVAIAQWDREGRYKFVNETYSHRFGLAPAECIGKHMQEIIGAEAYVSARQYLAALDRGERVEFEASICYPTAGQRHIRGAFVPELDGDKNVIGAIGAVTDLTEQKLTEEALQHEKERLRLALAGARAGGWETDLENGVNRWGQGMAELLGVPEERAAAEQSRWMEYIHPEDRQRVEETFWEAARLPGCQWNEEFRVTKPDGTTAWLAAYGSCFESSDGRRRMLGVSLDITARKAAEEVLRRSKEQLEAMVAERTARLQEVVNELEHLSYTITHDMRAPLRAMRGAAELIVEPHESWSDEERKRFLRRIVIAAERMDGLITDALNYTKAVREELLLVPIDLGRLLRGILETYPQFQAEKAEIVIPDTLPPVIGNEAGLTQCFSNLLSNAVKFAKPGERAVVKVRSEVLTGERSGWVRLWVEDRGVGISETMKPRVFDMFARGAHPEAGTGIGLALVRKVVDRMGGRVGVESEPGKGSRFWLELKLGVLP